MEKTDGAKRRLENLRRSAAEAMQARDKAEPTRAAAWLSSQSESALRYYLEGWIKWRLQSRST